jgi:hypothetical protein
MADKPIPEIVERVAQAICNALRLQAGGIGILPWDEQVKAGEVQARFHALAHAAIAVRLEPTQAMIEAAAWQISIRATQGTISPAKWESMPDEHRNGWESKNFWRAIAKQVLVDAGAVALGK